MKERFHVCVVAGGPPARGTLADAQGAESIAKRVAGILAASIAMENQSSTGMPTTHGCIEDSARQAGIAGAAEPPSEHPTGALVQHDGEKAPPTTDWEIGDVADPDLIGTRSDAGPRSEEHTSELQSRLHLVCRLLLEKKKKKTTKRPDE